MSLTINDFVTVRVEDTPTAIREQDQTLAVYLTDQDSDQFIGGLYMYAGQQKEVEQAFGTASEIAKATAKAFSSSKPPTRVMIAYWNKSGKAVVARANSLTATQAPVSFANLKPAYSFEIKSRNVSEKVDYIADEDVIDYDTFVVALNESLGAESRFVFSYADDVFTLSSKVLGVDVDTDNIQLIGSIADDLRLTLSRGVSQIRGINASTPSPQTIVDVISELDDKQPNFYGFYSSVELQDQDILDAHDRLQASPKKRLFAYTVQADYMLDANQSNPIYVIASKNSRMFNAQLNKLGDKHAAVTYMVQACSTNWAAQNTAQTMKFKTESNVQVDESITSTTAAKCEALGINFYTDYDGAAMLSQGTTVGLEQYFTDSQVGRDAIVNSIQVALANRLRQAPKVPQTDEGQVVLHNTCIATLEQFVFNGFGGRNQTWNGKPFGELKTGDNMPLGYYIWSDSYATQSQADREARKSMPIMIAFKESGAVHFADVILSLER